MKILYVPNENEISEEPPYNSFTEADVDVVNPSYLDFESMSEVYDVVLSELYPGAGMMAPDILEKFVADQKAIYTAWRGDDTIDNPSITNALDEYNVIHKPSSLDLKELVEDSLGL